GTALQGGLQAGVVADAAGQLDVHVPVLLDDPAQDRRVAAATECGIEVDEVDPLRTLVDPLPRGVERVAVAGLGARLSLRETDGLTAGDVDRREQGEGGR